MPNITETISLLDELRDKARGEHGWKVDGDESPYAAIKEVDGVRITTNDYGTGVGMDMEDAEYIVALHNNYEALRKAALDCERYRKAGEEEVKRFMETMQRRAEEITPNLLLNEIVNYAYSRMEELEAYRQAVEEK